MKELLRIVSLKKIVNLLLVGLGYFFSKWSGKPLVWGLPFSISYEPTTSCNLSCPECPTGMGLIYRPKGQLLQENFEKNLEQIAPKLLNIIFYFQGEPFLNPSLPQFIRWARYKKVFTMTSTNGHFLTKDRAKEIVSAGLHKLIVSVDGANQDTYAQYRKGGDLEAVLQGVRNVKKEQKRQGTVFPTVELQFLVFKNNEDQIPEMKRLAKELGVKLKLKSAQIYDFEQAHDLVPKTKKYARYRLNDEGKFEIKSKLDNHCWRLWSSSVITWDGRVLPCCFDKNGESETGKLPEQNFEQVWKSLKYKAFRHSVLKSRKSIEMCRNCTEGLKPEL